MTLGSSPLPPLYTAWITELLGDTPHNETRATCDDCVMCNEVAPGASSFNPETKCCTYLPLLANFLVGQVLADEDPAGEIGRASVRERIARGAAVGPMGLGLTASFERLYTQGGDAAFGQDRSMRCPHYIEEGGRCGVWKNRNSICATWFCKHLRGEVSRTFWDAVGELLAAIERDLARWCLLELDAPIAAIASALPAVRGSGTSSSASAADAEVALWGSWAGRAEDFYRACAARVATLDVPALLAVCGQEVHLRVKLTRAAWARLADSEPPPRLKMGSLVLLRSSREKQRVSTYSAFDPLEMPRAVFDALHYFDGRTVEEARAAIVSEGGPRLATSLIRKLADFEVLVPAGPAPKA